jgi:hypothetical protein
MDLYIEFANWLLDGLNEGLTWITGLLPLSPFAKWRTNPPSEINLGFITWFIPFPTMIVHFGGFLVAIGFWYLYRVIARWLKVARS